ncbi:MAG TPA: DUF4388 domain-containing protein [Labilithrix sp.]
MTIAIGLLKMLLELASARKCGAVDASAHGARVRIFIDDGEIVFAEEGSVGETLGRILVREKVITEDQYAAAIDWCAEARARGENAKLGGVLVEHRFIKPEQLHAALSAQVRQKVVRALGWPGARVSFVECHGALDVGGNHPTQLEPLLLAALRRVEASRLDDLFDQARGRFVALRSDRAAATATFERLASFRMQPGEDAFARSLSGAQTLDELLAEQSAGIDRAVVLAALLLTDCLDLHAAPTAPRDKPIPPPRPRRSLVPVEPPPPPSSRRTGAGMLARAQRRSSIEASPPSSQRGAQRLAARLRVAHDSARTLAAKPVVSAPAESPKAARLLAERAFQHGKRLARANRLSDALGELRRAQALHAAPEYDAWAAWAALRTDPDGAEAHAEALRESAERAVAQDPTFGFGLFALGYLALRGGDTVRGKELLLRARTLDPETVDAALDVKLRQPAPPSTRTAGEVRALAPPLGSTPQIVAEESVPETNREFPGPKSKPPEPRSLPPRPTPRGTPPPLPAQARRKGKDTADSEARAVAREIRADFVAEVDARATEKSIVAASDPAAAPVETGARAVARIDLVKRAPETATAPIEFGKRAPVLVDFGEPRNERRVPLRADTEARAARGDVASPLPREANAATPAAFSAPAPARGVRTSALLVVIAVVAAGIVIERSLPTSEPAVEARGGEPSVPSPSSGAVATFAESEPIREVPAEDASVVEQAPIAIVDAEAAPAAAIDAAVAAVVDASATADAASEVRDVEPEIPSDRGLLDLPRAANGHRIYFEGRVVGEPPAIITVPCGRHTIRAGSAGRDQLVDIPCGGRVVVAYP